MKNTNETISTRQLLSLAKVIYELCKNEIHIKLKHYHDIDIVLYNIIPDLMHSMTNAQKSLFTFYITWLMEYDKEKK